MTLTNAISTNKKHHVVVIGGGFGGLELIKNLKNANVRVTLIDRRNFHLFQALLYQVATGALSPENIAAPLRSILKQYRNVTVLLGEVTDVNVAEKKVILSDGEVSYDTLVVSAGARHAYFGHPEWEGYARGLKTIEDAVEIRRKVLLAFETAERLTDPAEATKWLTFVVIGGGPTGVEMAGAIAEIANYTMPRDFRRIDTSRAKVILLEGVDRILQTYVPNLSKNATRKLNEIGVDVRTNAMVTHIDADGVTYKQNDREKTISTYTVIWGAGVQASPLAGILAEATGAETDKAGRIKVTPTLQLPNHPEIFAIGDMTSVMGADGKPLPGVAPAAMQMGEYAARRILARVSGNENTIPAFRYNDLGSMATIGRAAAIADIRGLRLTGFIGWLAWLFVHLLRIVQFQSRVLVFFQWAYNYFTRNRSARLITGTNPLPLPVEATINTGNARSVPVPDDAQPLGDQSEPVAVT